MNRNPLAASLLLAAFVLLGCALAAPAAPAVKLSQPIAKYGTGSWNYAKLGNHRAVITVSAEAAKANVATVTVPWRRRDLDAGESNIILVGPNGKTIANRVATINTRDKLELVFQPTGAGDYYIYYLAQAPRPAGRYAHIAYFPATFYQTYKETADAKWAAAAKAATAPPAATLKEIQARSKYHSFYPMEVTATAEETAAVRAADAKAPFVLFVECRENSIRMQEHLPARWIENYGNTILTSTAQQNEYVTFQLGVYALKEITISPKNVAWSNATQCYTKETLPASAIRCFNLGGVDCLGAPFTKTITVKAGHVQPLWFGVDLPRDIKPGSYTGQVTIAAGKTQYSKRFTITVKAGVLEDRGDSDPHKMTRLRWLDSKIGISDTPPAPFTPVEVRRVENGIHIVNILGRSIHLARNATRMMFTSRIDMDKITTKGVARMVRGPVLSLQTGKEIENRSFAIKLVSQTKQRVAFRSISDQGDYTLQVDTSVEADGYMRQRLTIRAKKDVTLNPSLTFAAPATTFRYLKVKNTPGGYFKPMTVPIKGGLFDNILWMGDYNIGIGFKPKNDNDEWNSDRLTNRTTPNPDAWDNNGKGRYTFTVDAKTKTHTAVVSTGEIKLAAGKELRLNYALFLTPFKPLTPRWPPPGRR